MDIEPKKQASERVGGVGEAGARPIFYSRVMKKIILWTALGILAYLAETSSLPYGARPFGAALISAASGLEVFPVFVGLSLSALEADHPLIVIGIWSAVLLIRILSRLVIDTPRISADIGVGGNAPSGSRLSALIPHLFGENIALRVAVSAIAAFALSMIGLFKYDFVYSEILSLAIATFVSPLAAFFFSWAFEPDGAFVKSKAVAEHRSTVSGSAADIKKAVGIAALCLLAVFTLRGISPYSISLSAFFAMGATLFFTRTKGLLFGGVAGLAFGIVYSPLLSPIFVFAAFISGVLFPLSIGVGAWTSFAAGVLWGFYVKGIAALSGLFPALFASVLLFCTLDRLWISEKMKTKEKAGEAAKTEEKEIPCVVPAHEYLLDSIRLDASKQKIKSLCQTLSHLSKHFGEMSESECTYKSPAESYLNVCEAAFDSACVGCESRDICREKADISSASGKIARAILQGKEASISDAGQELSSVCGRLPDIIDQINHNATANARQSFEYDKCEIFSLDYAAVAGLIAEAQVEESEEFRIDRELTELLCRVINSSSLEHPPSEAMVYGSARRNVIFRGSQRSLSLNFERLTALAEEVLPFKLDRHDRDIYDAGDISVMIIKEAPAISVTYSLRSSTAAGQEICGDDLVAFCDDDAHFYACISDGMGSGKKAAAASQVVVDFIECMLSSGAATYGRSARSIIEMLNGFLRTKNFGSVDECSATVDLLELDTVNKSAFFCKCGAAPTYVYRGGSLFKLRSDTLPIGIMAEVDCRAIKFSVDAGDLLVMMSDGVVQGRDECPWLYDLLRANADKSSPDSIADKIIKYAKNSGSTDDISVAVIKIK